MEEFFDGAAKAHDRSASPRYAPSNPQYKSTPPKWGTFILERPRGIEPLSLPWQGRVLPLNHGRAFSQQLCWDIYFNILVPRVRIELTTRRSSGVCSTTELPRHSLLSGIFTLNLLFLLSASAGFSRGPARKRDKGFNSGGR